MLVHYYQRITGALPGENVFWGWEDKFGHQFIKYLESNEIYLSRNNVYDSIVSWQKIKLWEFGFESISYKSLKDLSVHISNHISTEPSGALIEIIEQGLVKGLGHPNLDEWESIEDNARYWDLITQGFSHRQFMWYIYSGQLSTTSKFQYGAIYRSPEQLHGLYLVYEQARTRIELVEQLIPSFLWSWINGDFKDHTTESLLTVLDKRIVDVFLSKKYSAHDFEYSALIQAFNSYTSCAVEHEISTVKAAHSIMNEALNRFLIGFMKFLVEYSEGEPCTDSESFIASAVDAGLQEVEKGCLLLVRQGV